MNKNKDIYFHGSIEDIQDSLNRPINWITKDFDYAKTFALDSGYIYTCKVSIGNLFDVGKTDDRVFDLLPIKPYKFSKEFNEIVTKLNIDEKIIRDLISNVAKNYQVNEYKLKIKLVVNTLAFKNILKGLGYNGIKAIEYDSINHKDVETYGIFDSVKIIDKESVKESLSEAKAITWGDLDYAKKTDTRNMMGGRGTGHFGTGFYFVGANGPYGLDGDKFYDYAPERPIYEIDLDKYKLFRPKDNEEAYKLHDAMRNINNYYSDDMYKFLFTNFDSKRIEDELYRLGNKALEVYEDLDDEFDDLDLDDFEDVASDLENSSKESQDARDVAYEKKYRELVLEFIKKYELDSWVPSYYSSSTESWLNNSKIGEIEKGVEEAIKSKETYLHYVEHALKDLSRIFNVDKSKLLTLIKIFNKMNSDETISTLLFKELGYEGVDVTHLNKDAQGLSGLDNFSYGTVIYDLKSGTYKKIVEPRKQKNESLNESSGGNTFIFKGKKCWSGAVNTLDGTIEEVHSYKEAKEYDFHHSFYFSDEQIDKMEEGLSCFFMVFPDHTIMVNAMSRFNPEDRDIKLDEDFLKSRIKEQIKFISNESLDEKIVKKDSKWQVQSEKGRNLGTYNTRKEAEKRLQQIHYFKHRDDLDEFFEKIDKYSGTDILATDSAYQLKVVLERSNEPFRIYQWRGVYYFCNALGDMTHNGMMQYLFDKGYADGKGFDEWSNNNYMVFIPKNFDTELMTYDTSLGSDDYYYCRVYDIGVMYVRDPYTYKNSLFEALGEPEREIFFNEYDMQVEITKNNKTTILDVRDINYDVSDAFTVKLDENLKESNESLVNVYTYQHPNVVKQLENGNTYRASLDRVSRTLKQPYSNLMKLFNLRSCPIFGCKDIYDAQYMADVSGVDYNYPLLHLRVPESEIKCLHYHDWDDYIYALDDVEGFEEQTGRKAEEVIKELEKSFVDNMDTEPNFFDYNECQIILDEIRPEWVVKKKVEEDYASKDDILAFVEKNIGTSDTPIDGPSYILPNGKFLTIWKSAIPVSKYSRSGSATHGDVQNYLKAHKLVKDDFMSVDNFELDELGCIRVNGNMEEYIVLPNIRPNETQWKSLLTWLDWYYGFHNRLAVCYKGHAPRYYHSRDYTTDEILKKCKEAYSRGYLVEDKNENGDIIIYRNKVVDENKEGLGVFFSDRKGNALSFNNKVQAYKLKSSANLLQVPASYIYVKRNKLYQKYNIEDVMPYADFINSHGSAKEILQDFFSVTEEDWKRADRWDAPGQLNFTIGFTAYERVCQVLMYLEFHNTYDGMIYTQEEYGDKQYQIWNSKNAIEYVGEVTRGKTWLDYESLNEDLQEIDSEGNVLSKEQINFFRNSVVRDEQGRLLVCYHGTKKDFDTFEKDKIRSGPQLLGSGFYFTCDKNAAKEYGKKVKKCYLNLVHPIANMYDYIDYCDDNGVQWSDYPDLRDDLIADGYDGIVVDNFANIVAFEPNQIKSIDNKNPSNSNNINENLNEDIEDNFENYPDDLKKRVERLNYTWNNEVIVDDLKKIIADYPEFKEDFIEWLEDVEDDVFNDHLRDYITSGFSSGTYYGVEDISKEDLLRIYKDASKTTRPLYRFETSCRASKVGDMIDMYPIRSFTATKRGMTYIAKTFDFEDDDDNTLYQTQGKTMYYDLRWLTQDSEDLGGEEEVFVWGKFRVVDISETQINNRTFKLMIIEQVDTNLQESLNEDKVLRLPKDATSKMIDALKDYYKDIHLEVLPIDKLVKDNDLLNDDDLQSYHQGEWNHALAKDFHIDHDKVNNIKMSNSPFVIKKKDGRLLISDGRHRTRAAYNDGYTHVEYPIYVEEKLDEFYHEVELDDRDYYYTPRVYVTDELHTVKEEFNVYSFRCCYDVKQNIIGMCDIEGGIHDDIDDALIDKLYVRDFPATLVRFLVFNKSQFNENYIDDEIDYYGVELIQYEYDNFYLVWVKEDNLELENTKLYEILGQPIDRLEYVK